jgi:hypothetical protein
VLPYNLMRPPLTELVSQSQAMRLAALRCDYVVSALLRDERNSIVQCVQCLSVGNDFKAFRPAREYEFVTSSACAKLRLSRLQGSNPLLD